MTRRQLSNPGPKYWAGTRARLDAAQLARECGVITVPAPLPAEEQRVAG